MGAEILRHTGESDRLKLLRTGQKEIAMAEENGGIQGVAWFIAGVSVGALIGILYAPKSGRETREDLAQKTREGKEYLRVRSRQAAEHMGTMVDKGKEQFGQYVDRGRDVLDKGRAQWEDFVERGKNMVNEQTSRVSAAVDAGREAYRSKSAEPAEPGA
jgi:gas vesicle protein